MTQSQPASWEGRFDRDGKWDAKTECDDPLIRGRLERSFPLAMPIGA